jgi:hypothetical protein
MPTSVASALTALFPAALLNTILGRLAVLFLAGARNDVTAAHQAAAQLLAAYHPETEDELTLAAEIISFSLHALEALSQAAAPDMPLTKILRLRGSAVSLSRESHKSQRRLDQLQHARRSGMPVETVSPQARPRVEKAIELVEAIRQDMVTTQHSGGKTWTQSYRQRQTAKRIADNLKKNQAAHAAQAKALPDPASAAAQ